MPIASKVHFKSTRTGQAQKNFRFNYVLHEKSSQAEVFNQLNINEFLESALAGYSVTIFAYGQTGSGKTFTMAGTEDKFNNDVYKSDENDGIIPRAIKNLWYEVVYSGNFPSQPTKGTQSKHPLQKFIMNRSKIS